MLLQSLILLAAIPSAGEVELFCFSSQWCEPCRLMQPAVDRLLAAGYPVRKIDIDRDQDMANRLGVH
jgi:thiol-disulfide isomerase/thioredoxin